jgi:hypothetical protein
MRKTQLPKKSLTKILEGLQWRMLEGWCQKIVFP